MIKLGPGNDVAAREALAAWPGKPLCTFLLFEWALTHFAVVTDSLHLGGGITNENALEWIDAGAEKVWSSV